MPRGPPRGRSSSLSGRSELPWRFWRSPSSTSLPSPRTSPRTLLVLPMILSLGFDIRFPSVLSETDRTTGLMTQRSSRMVEGCYGRPLSLGAAGRTFAPASAATRSVLIPESAWTTLQPFPPVSDIPITIQGQQPRAARRPQRAFRLFSAPPVARSVASIGSMTGR